MREKDIRELLTSAQGNRQVLQPPPKYEGIITSQRMDQRWAADVISFVSDPAKDGTKTYKYVLLVQDIFSRTLWAEAMTELQETTGAFATILQRSFPRKPGELNTDKDSSFTSRQFQAMLEERGIEHRTKEAANDIATIDAAIREVRQILGRRTLREGAGNWFHELDAAISGFNRTDHGALKQPGGDGGKAPGEVADDVHLRFQLRRENAEEAIENAELIKKRADRLRDAGGFRTLLQPMSFRRRAGRPNWSEKIHTVREVVGGSAGRWVGGSVGRVLVLFCSPAPPWPMPRNWWAVSGPLLVRRFQLTVWVSHSLMAQAVYFVVLNYCVYCSWVRFIISF